MKSGILIVPLIFILLAGGIVAEASSSPFQRSNRISDPPPKQASFKEQIISQFNSSQRELRSMVAGMVRKFKQEKSLPMLFVIAGTSFLYGLLHALGPGHGKGIVMSYLLSEKQPSLGKGLLTGCIVAFGEALTALIVVYSIYYFALGRLTSSFQTVESQLRVIAYVAILTIGCVLFVYRLHRHLPLIRGVSDSHAGHGHHHDRGNKGLAVAVMLGLIPCPGVMLLLVFMLTAQLPVWGVIFAFSMACGMAITISVFAIAVVFTKSRLLHSLSRDSKKLQIVEIVLELFGAGLVVCLALVMLFA